MTARQAIEAQADALLDTVAGIAAQGWCPATGGNFSCRTEDGRLLITASGRDKTRLRRSDLLLIDDAGRLLDGAGRPSDETAVHLALYALDPECGAVLHTHSVTSTVLTRASAGDWLQISGYEMQKSIRGQRDHAQTLRLRVFDNSQDMDALAAAITAQWQQTPLCGGLMLRGHGLYAWGRNLAEARRHLEGIEFLLRCELEQLRLGPQR